jgi:hypothetical protein
MERSLWEPLLTEESVEPRSKDRTTPPLQMSYPALEAFCKDVNNKKGRSRSVADPYIYVGTLIIKYSYVVIHHGASLFQGHDLKLGR